MRQNLNRVNRIFYTKFQLIVSYFIKVNVVSFQRLTIIYFDTNKSIIKVTNRRIH